MHLLTFHHFSLDDSDEINPYPMPLRGHQLAFRHHEIYITYSTFCRFIKRDPTVEFDTLDGAPFDQQSWRTFNKAGNNIIRYDDHVVLAGHSFGGCTVVRTYECS